MNKSNLRQNQIKINLKTQAYFNKDHEENHPSLPQQIVKKISSNSKSKIKKKDSINHFKGFFQDIIEKKQRDKCLICGDVYGKLENVFGCQHLYCKNCLISLFKYKLQAKLNIYCIQQGCNRILSQNSQWFKHMPQYIKKIYQKNKENNKNQQITNKQINPNQNNNSMITNFKAVLLKWKRCPNCSIFIDKPFNNNLQCQCMSCKYKFCFCCLKEWDSSHSNCNFNQVYHFKTPQNNCLKKFLFILLIILIPLAFFLLVALNVLLLFLAAFAGAVAGVIFCFLAIAKSGCNGGNQLIIIIFIISPFLGAIAGIIYGVIYLLIPISILAVKAYFALLGDLLNN